MKHINFYSESQSELFLREKFRNICFLVSCTARNLASGIEYYSNGNIKTFAPYETIFNLSSLLNDLEIVSKKLEHKIIIDSGNQIFSDKIRWWNQADHIDDVILKNKQIDKQIIKAVQNSDLIVVSLGTVEMWRNKNQIVSKLSKNQFSSSEIDVVYLDVDELLSLMKKIINCLKQIKESVAIQFSIPYVLLKASKKFSNLHLATMENYRILKNAIVILGEDYYFPEYELFKFYLEKNSKDFQNDHRHPTVYLISDVSKHIVSEVNQTFLEERWARGFFVNKVDDKGRVNGKECLY